MKIPALTNRYLKRLLVIPLLLLSICSSATNYYVKNGGSDTATGLSDASAWANVSKVVSSMSLFQPGDSILFKKGSTWTNALLTIGRAGIAGKNIIISSYGSGAKPILSAQAGMPTIYVTTSGRGYWTIDDLDIKASTPVGGNAQTLGIYFGYWLADIGPVPGWEIKNCTFNCSVLVSGPNTWIHHNTFAGNYSHTGYNVGGAIIVRGPEGDDNIIEHNTVYGWNDRAIWIMRGGSNPVIRFNTAYDIWGTASTDHCGTGINIDGYGVAISGAKVYNNYVYNSTGLGLSLENAFGAEAYNNRFINCGWGGFSIYWYPEHQGKPSNVNIHHNVVYNGAWGVLVNVASHWTIANNVFIKNDTGGATSDKNALFVGSASTYVSDGTFANNIIGGSGYVHAVKLPDTKNIWTLFDYNIIKPVGTEVVARGGTSLTLSQVQALGFMTHGSIADPKLVNSSSDWHLQSGSPAINTGTNLGFTSDFDGKAIDSSPDMGACEYNGTVTTPAIPAYVSSAVQNASPSVVEITYNMTLANIVPAASSFSVMVKSVARTVSSVSISGTKVLLTLSSPVASGDAVTVAYTKPSTNPLQTSAGGQAATYSAKTVTNNVSALIPVYVSSVVQNVAPSVVEITYNTTLANIVPAASAFSVMVKSIARTVGSVSISGTKVLLTLSSPVASGDAVTVAYTKPSTNPLQTSEGGQAVTFSAKTVTNNVSSSTVSIPAYVSSTIQNATPSVLEMTYNLTLANIVPSPSAFSVMVKSIARTVSSVSISGTKVLLTLSGPVASGDAVTVAYTKPSTNPLQTSIGGQAVTFSAKTVTNNVSSSTVSIPVYVSSTIQNATPSVLEMTYNLTLAKIVPSPSEFSVMVKSAARTVSSVSISGTKVLLTLSGPVAYGDAVTVAYTKPSTNPLQTSAGGQAATFSAQQVTVYVMAIPEYVSSAIQNATPSVLEISYNFPIVVIAPPVSAFTVRVNTLLRSVNSVSVSGTKVMLTLSSPVSSGDAVTVAYTKPSTNPIQISSGGQATSLNVCSVTNNITSVSAPPPVYVSSIIQSTTPAVVEMTYSLTLANIVPSASAFTVMVNSATRQVNSVTISGTKVLLTLSSPAIYGNVVTVAYNNPTTNSLRTAAGGQAASLSPQSVLNYVRAVPIYVSSLIKNVTPYVLEMSYNFPLVNIVPATSAFVVRVNSVIRTVTTVTISGTKVLLTLSNGVTYGNTVTVSYTKPAINPIQISSGGQASSIVAQTTTNTVTASVSAYYANMATSTSQTDTVSFNSSESKTELEDKIKIYPNPVSDIINITGGKTSIEARTLRIYDFSGRLCMESRLDLSPNNAAIPINLRSGFYILKIFSGKVILYTEKILVQ